MLPPVPTPLAPAGAPSTKAWLLLLSLLTTLLAANYQLKPAAALAGRPAASPRLELRRPAPRPAVVFAASASL